MKFSHFLLNRTAGKYVFSARICKKITFFNAVIGSVEHNLIYRIMARYNLPPVLTQYIRNLYSRLNESVTGPKWNSHNFSFKRGVFQGDPYSPILFLFVFNPIIQHLKSQECKYGYNLNPHNYITLPFADDFCLISTNKLTHQRLIPDINEKLLWIYYLNRQNADPFQSVRVKPITFLIGKTPLPTVLEKPEKFIGSYITYFGKNCGNVQHHTW